MTRHSDRCVTCSGLKVAGVCLFCKPPVVTRRKAAGSGQIAGLTWRHQMARDQLARIERERAK